MKKYFSRTKKEAAKKMIEVKKENQPFYDAVKQFEKNEIATVQSKAKLLTRLCVAEFVVIGLLGAGIAALAPLKTAVPYIIRVDNSTGYTDVVPQISMQKKVIRKLRRNIFFRSLSLIMNLMSGRLFSK